MELFEDDGIEHSPEILDYVVLHQSVDFLF